MRFYKFLLIFLLVFIPVNSFAIATNQYLIVISIEGFRYDYFHNDSLTNIQKMQKNGVKAFSLEPVFPTTFYPNYFSIMTGLSPENHGIISNYFINPFTKETFSIHDVNSQDNYLWLNGVTFWETLKKHNVKSAGLGISNTIESLGSDYPIDTKNLNIFESMNKIINLLSFDYNNRPHFILFRYDNLDNTAHKYGLNSKELNIEMANIDSSLGILTSFITKMNLKDSINIILMSPHGISDFNPEHTINISKILKGFDYSYQNYGSYMMINTKKENLFNIYLKLKDNQNHYKVYTKNEIPKYLHFSNNSFISPILLIADKFWMLSDSNTNSSLQYLKATHGYSNKDLDMHGIFVATGPLFKKNLHTQTLLNIDLYPLLCKIFGIKPLNTINGDLERIEFILKGN